MDDVTFVQTAEQAGFDRKRFGDYIRRGAVLAKAYWHGDSCTQSNPYPDGVEAVDVSAIEQIPTADVRPVVRASWIDTMSGWECSHCHVEQEYTKWFDYCPYCGADMREPNLDTTKGDSHD